MSYENIARNVLTAIYNSVSCKNDIHGTIDGEELARELEQKCPEYWTTIKILAYQRDAK